ncbi:hypothetical protein TIFTF001_028942 [Ficus carica]|uniref:C2H2-type domain-containing protein n=1 Tax=Ficus carica TaxID=3494 RepID=A0AA88DQZ0_FICCA|nr:hypothetical protein TIFTF001_028942 [Ficus carica]
MGIGKEAANEGKKVIKRPDDDHQDPNTDHDHDQQHMTMNINHGDERVEDKALGGHKKPHNLPPYINKNKRKGIVLDFSDTDDDEEINTSSVTAQDSMISDYSSIATPKRPRQLMSSSTLDSANSMKQPPFLRRSNRKRPSTTSTSTGNKEMFEGAINLMLLSRGKRLTSLLPTPLQINDDEGKEKGLVTKLNCNGGTSTSTGEAKSGGGPSVCKDCNISFPSNQAIGDHGSSEHTKNIKIKFSFRTDDNNDDWSLSVDETAGTDGKDDVSDQKGRNKIAFDFDLNELPPSDVSDPKGGRKIVFDFDLNELPPSEE